MKKSIAFWMVVAAFILSAAVIPSFINNGKLQSDLNMGGFKATNGATATLDGDLTTKGYVDAKTWSASSIASGTIAAARMPALTGDVTTSAGSVATTISAGAVDNGKIASGAAIARSKLATGTANHVLINDGSGVPSSEATLGAARFPALTGDVTTPGGSLATTIANSSITDAKVSSSAAISWSKVSKTGSSLADLDTRSAGDLSSGTISSNRLPTLVKDLANITGVTGDLFWYDGANFTRLPKGTEGYILVMSNGVPTWTTNIDQATITNLNTTIINATTIKVSGKNVPAVHVNSTNTAPEMNIQDTTMLKWLNTPGSSNWAPTVQALTGDVTTSGTAATLKATGTAGTYRSVTFDAQGRETSGSNPTTFSGYGLSDTSANLASALTDETGTGAAVFGTDASLTRPAIAGATLSGSNTNSAGTASRFVTLDSAKVFSNTGASADLAATLSDETGTGLAVFGTDPSLTRPAIAGGTLSGNTTNSSLTASRPMKSDANKVMVSGQIDLSTANDVTGVLLAAGFPALTGDVTTSAGALASTIAANAVTLPKIVNATATQRVLGRNTSGSGNWEEVTASQLHDWIGSTRGSTLYRGASGWAILAPNTAGYVLTDGGVGADPAWAAAAGGSGLATSASAYSIAGGQTTATANWTSLSNAYVTAKAATPHGNALATGNRYTIFLLPGKYDLGSGTLTLNTEFIDFVGLSQDTGSRYYNSVGVKQGDTLLTSSGNTIIINATANDDIALVNLNVVTTGSSSDAITLTTTGVLQRMINLLVQNTSALGNHAFPYATTLAGYYEDVRCWNTDAFSYSGTCSGIFIRCKAGDEAFAQNGTCSGTFIDCEAGDGFGGNTCSGTFIRCRWVPRGGTTGIFGSRSGATVSGTFTGCIGSGDTHDFGGFAGTMSGTLQGCINIGVTPAWASVTGRIFACDFAGWNGAYAVNTADSTQISNTASESNFSVTKTIAAGAWKVGRRFRWEAWGKYSSTNITPGTITFKTKFGSTAANTSDAMTLPLGESNGGWRASGIFVCRTVGGSGTISSQSHWEMDQSTLGVLNESLKPSNGTTTIANNGSLTFQVSVTFSVASASNAITLENFDLEPSTGL